MFTRLIAAWPLERYQLWLTFADGTEGPVDLETDAPATVLEAVRDVRVFRRATVDRTRNCLVWPDGTDLGCEDLYRRLRRRQWQPASARRRALSRRPPRLP